MSGYTKWDGDRLPSLPPWRRKKIKVDTSISKVANKNENPIALKKYCKGPYR